MDDDSGARAIAEQAERSGLSLLRSDEAGLRGAPDLRHLQFAAENQMVLVSANARDFIPLHWSWRREGRRHAGIIIAAQSLPFAERIRRLLEIGHAAEPEDLADSLLILTQWA
jgi:hypothetical protein